MISAYEPRRYIGLRITGDKSYCLDQFKLLDIPNPYFYGHHTADASVKNDHTHFVILRDWDATVDDRTNSKRLYRQLQVGSKTELKSSKMFAFSFHTNALIQAANYLMHDTDCKIMFSDHKEWEVMRPMEFKYEILKKKTRDDGDIEDPRKEQNHIPLNVWNIVPVLQRFDRIRKNGKRPFKQALQELISTTRYRIDRKNMPCPIPRELVEEYELGMQETSRRVVDRYVPY